MAVGLERSHDACDRSLGPYWTLNAPANRAQAHRSRRPFNNPFTGNWVCNGRAVALRMGRLRLESEALGLNLDRFLSHQLARGFSLNYVKRPVLIWFGLRFDCAILTFSDKLDRYYPE